MLYYEGIIRYLTLRIYVVGKTGFGFCPLYHEVTMCMRQKPGSVYRLDNNCYSYVARVLYMIYILQCLLCCILTSNPLSRSHILSLCTIHLTILRTLSNSLLIVSNNLREYTQVSDGVSDIFWHNR